MIWTIPKRKCVQGCLPQECPHEVREVGPITRRAPGKTLHLVFVAVPVPGAPVPVPEPGVPVPEQGQDPALSVCLSTAVSNARPCFLKTKIMRKREDTYKKMPF